VQRGFDQQVAHRGDVAGAMRQRQGNGGVQPVMTKLLAQCQHANHRAGAVLLAVPLAQLRPQVIVADRPAARRAPLRQRLRPGKRARLVAQHVEIMLKIKHMLAAAVTALVTRN
jgi:hypothetical protein